MRYRAALEDQPERTALLDGLLKRKDEVYNDLARRYDLCANQRMEQQMARDIDREHFSGVRQELHREIANLKEYIEELVETSAIYRKQNKDLCDVFTERLFDEDMVNAINAEYEVQKKDNASLVKMVQSREVRIQEIIAEIPPLKVRIVELENALETSKLAQDRFQIEANGLDLRKSDLELALQTQEMDFDIRMKDAEVELQKEKQKFEDVFKDGSPSSVQRYFDLKNREMDNLRANYQQLEECTWGYKHRVIELYAGFDPVINGHDYGLNTDAEGKEQRLRIAERALRGLEHNLKEIGIWSEVRGEVDPRLQNLEEMEALIDEYAGGGHSDAKEKGRA